MKLVFVHGMSQQGKDRKALRLEWEAALIAAWHRAELDKPDYTLEMPFYGDDLERLTTESRKGNLVFKGDGTAGSPASDLETELLREMGRKQGIRDVDIRQEAGQEVAEQGPENWEWLQALARLLDRNTPLLGKGSLYLVRQVDTYLRNPAARQAVDSIVEPALAGGPAVVVAHSLGTIVSYLLLRKLAKGAKVPLFVTLGSPLGINAVQAFLKPPKLGVPVGVSGWLNGADERDPVALVSRLDEGTFSKNIENISDILNRRENPHYIGDYLNNPIVAKRIHDALKA